MSPILSDLFLPWCTLSFSNIQPSNTSYLSCPILSFFFYSPISTFFFLFYCLFLLILPFYYWLFYPKSFLFFSILCFFKEFLFCSHFFFSFFYFGTPLKFSFILSFSHLLVYLFFFTHLNFLTHSNIFSYYFFTLLSFIFSFILTFFITILFTHPFFFIPTHYLAHSNFFFAYSSLFTYQFFLTKNFLLSYHVFFHPLSFRPYFSFLNFSFSCSSFQLKHLFFSDDQPFLILIPTPAFHFLTAVFQQLCPSFLTPFNWLPSNQIIPQSNSLISSSQHFFFGLVHPITNCRNCVT